MCLQRVAAHMRRLAELEVVANKVDKASTLHRKAALELDVPSVLDRS